MTEIEKKALALVNDIRVNQGYPPNYMFIRTFNPTTQALCRAIEQHEAYKQEVSDGAIYADDRAEFMARHREQAAAEERAKIVAWVESLWPFPHHFCIPAKHIAMGIDSGFYETFTRSDDT